MREVPRHDHPKTVIMVLASFLFAGLLVICNEQLNQEAHPVYRPELRCSAFVTPPKGCKP